MDQFNEPRLLHDVNAALQLVIGNLELLDMMGGLDPERQALVADAMVGATDATRLVQQLQQRLKPAAAGSG